MCGALVASHDSSAPDDRGTSPSEWGGDTSMKQSLLGGLGIAIFLAPEPG